MMVRRFLVLAFAAVTLLASGVAASAAPALLSDLVVRDKAHASSWSVQTNLQTGDRIYPDRTYTFTEVPPVLAGAAWIRDAGDSKSFKSNPLATFTSSAPAAVYIGLDTRASTPSWLDHTWAKTGVSETGSEGATYQLYSKSFAAGPVTLGPTAGSSKQAMYTIAVVPSAPAANDFSLAVDPATQAVTVGASATYTVHTGVVAGTPGPVTLTTSTPPAGVTVVFSANPVPAGGDATMTVATSTSAATGAVQLTVTGTDTDAAHQATAGLTINPVGGGGTGYEAEAPANTLSGKAARRACAICSGGGEVGDILGHGSSDALQFNGITVPVDGVYQVTWSYISGDPNGDTKCGGEPNPPPQGCRPGDLVVNGVTPGTVYQFPDTANWHTLGTVTFPLKLKAGTNTIKISSSGADVADIDRIVVAS